MSSPESTSACMRHQPALRRFVNRLGDGRVIIKLESACDAIENAQLVRRDGKCDLGRLGNFNGKEYFSATLPADTACDYVFHVHACGQPRWLTPQGMEVNSAKPAHWFRYEPAAHKPFETPAWVRDAVFYQIFPERFWNGDSRNDPPNVEPWGTPPAIRNFMGGDLQGILDKLDYLSDLGVSALYLTPVFHSASNHKYDTIDYFTIDPHFGDVALLRRLVDTCHARGIRVILDAVFNHCSNLHPFFVDVREKGKESPYWDWFGIKKWPIPDKFARHKDALEWYDCWWGFYTLPKLNFANRQVEEYFLRVAQFWLREAHVDGWRLDVPNEVIASFWPKFRAAVKEVNPEAYIVGEIWEDATSWLMGDEFDAVMNYRFQKALLNYFAEETIDTKTLDHNLRQIMLDYPEQATAVMLNLLGSHDTARPMTACLQGGSGLSATTGRGVEAAPTFAQEAVKLMATLQFTFEGAPCIYYGDEIGMEGGKDPDCRRCFLWGREQKSELFAYYQKLIAIRKQNPALRAGTFRPLIVDNERDLYAYERRADGNRCVVAFNRGTREQAFELKPATKATELISGCFINAARYIVPARQAVILQCKD